jgi:hypothetical protein
MNPQEKIDLKKLIGNMGDYEDNTAGIREMKHSDAIRADIQKMVSLKQTRNADISDQAFSELCESECSFLFYKYTDIFRRLLRDEINLTIMSTALKVLKKIEDGEIDQQEGSVIVGKLFHEIYVDSALRRSENLDKAAAANAAVEDSSSVPKYEGKNLSWKEYRNKKTEIEHNIQG